MTKRIILALFASLLATQASALSCLKPDVAKAFNEASSSDLTYVIVKGSFAFTAPERVTTPEPQTLEAQFTGRLLTDAGFTQSVTAPVTLDLICSGDWCGTLEPQTDYIAFIENDNNERLVFSVDACGSLAFKQPTQEDIKRVENCAQGGQCAPAASDDP